jgi:hypothetical protein
LDSKTPGHPEAHDTEGIEVTTGPLGQGFSNAVGLAIAQHHAAGEFNKPGFELINNYTYTFLGDGSVPHFLGSDIPPLKKIVEISKSRLLANISRANSSRDKVSVHTYSYFKSMLC